MVCEKRMRTPNEGSHLAVATMALACLLIASGQARNTVTKRCESDPFLSKLFTLPTNATKHGLEKMERSETSHVSNYARQMLTVNLKRMKTAEFLVQMPQKDDGDQLSNSELGHDYEKILPWIPYVGWTTSKPERRDGGKLRICLQAYDAASKKLLGTETCGHISRKHMLIPSNNVLALLQRSKVMKVKVTSQIPVVADITSRFSCKLYKDSRVITSKTGLENTIRSLPQEHTSFNPTELQDGIPIRSVSLSNGYQYFKFTPTGSQPSTNPVIQIYLTPISGDPDMYASTTLTKPTMFNNTWQSNGIDDEAILIFSNRNDYTWPDSIYIAVHGFFETSEYSIEASTTTVNSSVELNMNQAQWGMVAGQTLTYYRLPNVTLPSGQRLVFSLDSFMGQSDIYVASSSSGSPLRFPLVKLNHLLRAYVDPSTYDKKGTIEDDDIEVEFSDFDDNTSFIVAVFGDTSEETISRFSVYTTVEGGGKDTIIPLQFDHHLEGNVSGSGFVYYSLKVTEDQVDVAVVLSSSHFVTLYATANGTTFPNSTNSDYSATTGFSGMANLYMSYPSLKGSVCQKNVSSGGNCLIYVAVSSPIASNYAIEASYSNSSENPFPLPTNNAHTGFLYHGHYDFFAGALDLSKNETIHVNLLTYAGDADLYLTLGDHPQGFGRYHYNYSSRDAGTGVDSVSIYADDGIRQKECPCPPSKIHCICPVRMSVYDYDAIQGTLYGITVETNGTITSLPHDGTNLPGSASPGKSEYFRVNMDSFSPWNPIDLNIEVELDDGEVQLLGVQDDGNAPPMLPVPENDLTYSWKTAPSSGSVLLTVGHNDSHACHAKFLVTQCSYIFGVHSTSTANAVFSISAVTRAPGPQPGPEPTVEFLVNGREKVAEVNKGEWAYFSFKWTDRNVTNKNVTFVWEANSGPGIDVFFTNTWNNLNSTEKFLPPASTCYNASSDTNTVTFTPSSPCFQGANTTYTVGIRGNSPTPGSTDDDDEDATEFSLLARTNDLPIQLAPGQQSQDITLEHNSIAYFTFPYNLKTNIFLEPTVKRGHVFLYLSNNASIWPTCPGSGQTCRNFNWSTTERPGEPLFVNRTVPCKVPPASRSGNCDSGSILNTPAHWILAVQAFSNDPISVFSIIYNTGSSSDHLADGAPLASQTRFQQACSQRNELGVCIGPPSDVYNASVSYFNFNAPPDSGPLPQLQISVAKTGNARNNTILGLNVAVISCGKGKTCTNADRFPLASVAPYGGNPTFEFSVSGEEASIYAPQEYLDCNGEACNFYIAVYSKFVQENVDFRIIVSTDRGVSFVGWASDNHSLPPQLIVGQNPTALNTFEVIAPSEGSPFNVFIQAEACFSTPAIYVCYRDNNPSNPNRCSRATAPGPGNYVTTSKFDATTSIATVPEFSLSSGSMYVSVLAQSSDLQSLRKEHSQSGLQTFGRNKAVLNIYFGKPPLFVKPKNPPTSKIANQGITASWPAVVFNNGSVAPVSFKAYVALQSEIKDASKYHINTTCGFFGAWESKLDQRGLSSYTGTARTVQFSQLPPNKYTLFVVANCSDSCMGNEPEQFTMFPPYNFVISDNPNPNPHGGGGHHSKGGAIAGGVIGAIIGIAAIAGVIFWYVRYRQPSSFPMHGEEFTSSYEPMN